MKKVAYLVILFGCMVLMPLVPVSARADDVVVGVNLVNQPDQLTPQEQDIILDNMTAAGVRVIRAGIANNDKSLDFAQRVYAHGIKIEWFAWGIPSLSGNMILSSADRDKFRTHFSAFACQAGEQGNRACTDGAWQLDQLEQSRLGPRPVRARY